MTSLLPGFVNFDAGFPMSYSEIRSDNSLLRYFKKNKKTASCTPHVNTFTGVDDPVHTGILKCSQYFINPFTDLNHGNERIIALL